MKQVQETTDKEKEMLRQMMRPVSGLAEALQLDRPPDQWRNIPEKPDSSEVDDD